MPVASLSFRRLRVAAVGAVAVLALLVLGVDSSAATAPVDAEITSLVNLHRSSLGLAPLVADPGISIGAEAWSAAMAATGNCDGGGLAHDATYSPASPSVPAGTESVGENVLKACSKVGSLACEAGVSCVSSAGLPGWCVGPIEHGTAADIACAWLDSPGHRANIERPEFTHIGVGTVTRIAEWHRQETLEVWSTMRFARVAAPATPTPMPTQPPPPTATPQPTATAVPEPTATPVPEPTATPMPTQPPAPTATASVTPVSEPTAAPVPEPTATATVTPVSEPSATPTATPVPESTATATVTPVSEPSATPTAATPTAATPTAVPESTASPEPEPTGTPEPTATAAPAPSATAVAISEPTGPAARQDATGAGADEPAGLRSQSESRSGRAAPVDTQDSAQPTDDPDRVDRGRRSIASPSDDVSGASQPEPTSAVDFGAAPELLAFAVEPTAPAPSAPEASHLPGPSVAGVASSLAIEGLATGPDIAASTMVGAGSAAIAAVLFGWLASRRRRRD